MKKTFVIGDIHGCHDSLLALLDKISPDSRQDRLIFLGDYIDRGPNSKKVIAEIIKLQGRFSHIITLMGNHERMFLNFLAGRDQNFFLQFGGKETLMSYGLEPPFHADTSKHIPADHITFLNELLLYWEDENYIYVHAGLQPEIHLSQQSSEWLLWARGKFIQSEYDFGKPVIFGHTNLKKPLIEKNKIGIDTGAVYGGRLSCLVLPDIKFISVDGYNCRHEPNSC